MRTEACGLCSGELMAWYMEKKLPHVLGHEVAGIVEESEDDRFPVGCRIFPHHHATLFSGPRAAEVHQADWRRNRLSPGGMSEHFVVAPEALSDCHRVDDLRAMDAALAEPIACVVKAIRPWEPLPASAHVVGLGVMGLLHLALLRHLGVRAYGTDPLERRRAWAAEQGFEARTPDEVTEVEAAYVCPGSQRAYDGTRVSPGGTIVMFAPLAPGERLALKEDDYFRDVTLRHSYSAGPSDCRDAVSLLRAGVMRAETLVETFIGLDQLPGEYVRMRDGEIIKTMVVFPEAADAR